MKHGTSKSADTTQRVKGLSEVVRIIALSLTSALGSDENKTHHSAAWAKVRHSLTRMHCFRQIFRSIPEISIMANCQDGRTPGSLWKWPNRLMVKNWKRFRSIKRIGNKSFLIILVFFAPKLFQLDFIGYAFTKVVTSWISRQSKSSKSRDKPYIYFADVLTSAKTLSSCFRLAETFPFFKFVIQKIQNFYFSFEKFIHFYDFSIFARLFFPVSKVKLM